MIQPQELLMQLIFGLPGVIITFLLALAGLLMKNPLLLVISGIYSIPATYYLTGRVWPIGFILMLIQFCAAFAVRKQRTCWLWLLLIPLGLAVVYMAFLYTYAFLTNGR